MSKNTWRNAVGEGRLRVNMRREGLTTWEVSRLCGVSLGTVIHWARRGWLRTARTPGGHRRIRAEDLASCLHRRGSPIPGPLRSLIKPAILLVSGRIGAAGVVRRALKGVTATPRVLVAADGVSAGFRLARERPALLVMERRDQALASALRRAARRDWCARGVPVLFVTDGAITRGSRDWTRLREAAARIAGGQPVRPIRDGPRSIGL